MLETADVNRTKLLTIRMTEEEHERAERVARRRGESISDAIRSLLKQEDERLHTELSESEMLDRAYRVYTRKAKAELRRQGHASASPAYPNSSLSGYVEGGVFELRNVNGLLGRYRYDAKNDRVVEVNDE